MAQSHTLGFPRIGARRELKFALEGYWKGDKSRAELEQVAADIRQRNWAAQAANGQPFVTVNDFAFYDQVLDHSVLFGAIPARFRDNSSDIFDTCFRMARGRAPTGAAQRACEMTKWFDTNYHYMVPEFSAGQSFELNSVKLFAEIAEARALGHQVKPVILGPVSYLWLGKGDTPEFDRLSLLPQLLEQYQRLFAELAEQQVEWIQLDEPVLVLELDSQWQQALQTAAQALSGRGVKLLLASYFGTLADNLELAAELPVQGFHLDTVRGGDEYQQLLAKLKTDQVLSLGVVDGRNIWKSDLNALIKRLRPVAGQLGDRLWLSSSCSLLHVPVDLDQEDQLDSEIKNWLAFATQKLDELAILTLALNGEDVSAILNQNAKAVASRRSSERVHKAEVKARCQQLSIKDGERDLPYAERAVKQQERLQLPAFPTTSIGSFPQTQEIRKTRAAFKQGAISGQQYSEQMKAEIADCIARQEKIGIDMLVHGEAERNDMVEYFGELLDGYAFSRYGWVQSYGSRCVKPPIIFGDVARPQAMTVGWSRFAQSLTDLPVKGMLTGPITMLQWAFVRDDQTREQTALQIALALRDEVVELEEAGIAAIQIDEPAIREGLPLKRSEWQQYLDWAVYAFRVSASGVRADTQIHTHMCYSEFNDIIDSIAALDADVITIETSRSNMDLLDAFVDFEYPNEIGPGVYDIHSPNIPAVEEMVELMEKAAERIPAERLWVNPDCGLKTRRWEEVTPSLLNMVEAAHRLRNRKQDAA